MQSGLVNNVVEQTQGALNQADGMADKATSGIDTAQKTGKDAEDLLNKAQEKTQKPNTDTENPAVREYRVPLPLFPRSLKP